MKAWIVQLDMYSLVHRKFELILELGLKVSEKRRCHAIGVATNSVGWQHASATSFGRIGHMRALDPLIGNRNYKLSCQFANDIEVLTRARHSLL